VHKRPRGGCHHAHVHESSFEHCGVCVQY
jgi:hypothetical protein